MESALVGIALLVLALVAVKVNLDQSYARRFEKVYRVRPSRDRQSRLVQYKVVVEPRLSEIAHDLEKARAKKRNDVAGVEAYFNEAIIAASRFYPNTSISYKSYL